jgi:hypothetical protein
MKLISLFCMYVAFKCIEASYLLDDIAFGFFAALFIILSLFTWIAPTLKVVDESDITYKKGGD